MVKAMRVLYIYMYLYYCIFKWGGRIIPLFLHFVHSNYSVYGGIVCGYFVYFTLGNHWSCKLLGSNCNHVGNFIFCRPFGMVIYFI